MQPVIEALRFLLAITFLGLSALAYLQWKRRRTAAASWLVTTFGILGLVAGVDLLLPTASDSPVIDAVRRGYVAVLVLYPFCLYEFTSTFRRFPRWADRAAEILTGIVVIGALALEPPPPDSLRPPFYQAFIYLFAFQWVTLSSIVAFQLWISGRRQPTVARRRMHTMAFGSTALTLTIVLAGLPSAPISYWNVIFRFTALLSGPMFLFGFAPPGWILAIWRRKDEAALREAEIGLMEALTPRDVASSLLPKLSRLIGARGALLYHTVLGVIGVHGLEESHRNDLELQAAKRIEDSDSTIAEGQHLWVRLHSGWLVVAASPFTPFFGEEEARTLAALGVLTDMAISRADLFERERQNAEAMRDFVAIASHDLRTPITILKGFARILLDREAQVTEDRRDQILRAIDRQSDHLSNLVEDLLTVSKIEARTVDPQPAAVSVRKVALAVAEEASVEEVDVEVHVRPNIMVWVDPDHLHRMLMNYVRNAMVYGKPPFSIESRESEDSVEIRVMDQGIGVPLDFRDRLFERFSRYDKKMSNSSHGTGLGLSIVRGLARAAGGEAWYEPNRPTGSVFIVKLHKTKRGQLIAG